MSLDLESLSLACPGATLTPCCPRIHTPMVTAALPLSRRSPALPAREDVVLEEVSEVSLSRLTQSPDMSRKNTVPL